MVRLEGESSNSILNVLECWDTYLQAEKIDLDNSSKSNAIEVLSETKTNRTAAKAPTSSRLKPGIQRLEP